MLLIRHTLCSYINVLYYITTTIKVTFFFTCSMTSGAIQHGVPTNVFLTLFRVTSPPVAKNALTPKSGKRKRIRPYFMLCLVYKFGSQPHLSLVGFRTVTNSCKHIRGAFSEVSQGYPAICHLPSTLQKYH